MDKNNFMYPLVLGIISALLTFVFAYMGFFLYHLLVIAAVAMFSYKVGSQKSFILSISYFLTLSLIMPLDSAIMNFIFIAMSGNVIGLTLRTRYLDYCILKSSTFITLAFFLIHISMNDYYGINVIGNLMDQITLNVKSMGEFSGIGFSELVYIIKSSIFGIIYISSVLTTVAVLFIMKILDKLLKINVNIEFSKLCFKNFNIFGMIGILLITYIGSSILEIPFDEVVRNITLAMVILLYLQGMSFISFYIIRKYKSIFFSFIIAVVSLFIPFITLTITTIGIVDISRNFRRIG
ncbi:MAG: hypothetical protein CSB16_01730 [Clostridiales bacterium]|nr:MAG: hypothetical protein CSB16_01730 [Clostridiales bacterium]